MGATFSHISFKGANPQDVGRVIRDELPRRVCFVTLHDRRWVTVFDKLCNDQLHDEPIVSLGSAVCRRCRCEAIAFSVVHSDYICYWVFDAHGNLVDESCPQDDREDMTQAERLGLAGRPEAIAVLGADRGVTVDRVRDVLERGSEGFLDLTVQSLAGMLCIEYSCFSYDVILEEFVRKSPPPGLPYNWRDEFLYIGPEPP